MTDFYDQQSFKQLWPNARAKSYNSEIDEHETSFQILTTQEPPMIKDQINPDHYKNVAYGYQYMDLMVPMLDRFNGVEAHLMGQIYKYLMRSKLKDPFVQDLTKAKWYLDKLIEVSSK